MDTAVRHRGEPPHQLHPQIPQHAVVQVVATSGTGGLQVGDEPRALRGQRLVEKGRPVQPRDDVLVAEPPREPRCSATGQDDVPPAWLRGRGGKQALVVGRTGQPPDEATFRRVLPVDQSVSPVRVIAK